MRSLTGVFYPTPNLTPKASELCKNLNKIDFVSLERRRDWKSLIELGMMRELEREYMAQVFK